MVHIDWNPIEGEWFKLDMKTQDHMILKHAGRFLEIKPPERLVFTWKSSAVLNEITEIIVEFRERSEDCELILIQERIPDEESFNRQQGGWRAILEMLDAHLTP